jgi:hypothetical protein
MKTIVCWLAVTFSLTNSAFAAIHYDDWAICPLCKSCQSWSGILIYSGNDDVGLDDKPLGYRNFLLSEWPVECPDCHFPITDEGIPAEEIGKCKQIIAAGEYKKFYQKNALRSSYILWGFFAEKLGRDELTLAGIYLKASWDEDGSNFKDDLARSERHFRAYLAKAKEHGEPWQHAQLLLGDILRRQAKFADAKKQFDSLTAMKEFQGNKSANVVALEQKLIAKKDSAEHGQREAEPKEQPKPGRENASKGGNK